MRKAAIVFAAMMGASMSQAHDVAAESGIRQVLEAHDCCERLDHTEITLVGEISSGEQTFTIYSLWFVNPQSRHGMKRLAVTQGNEFLGSYIISSWATPILEGEVVTFNCQDSSPCEGEDFAIVDGELPPRLWVDGEINQLEDTI